LQSESLPSTLGESAQPARTANAPRLATIHHNAIAALPRSHPMMQADKRRTHTEADYMSRLPLAFLLIASIAYSAEGPFPVRELTIDGIYATRAGDPARYCLLGANTCLFKLPHNPWTTDSWIDSWLIAHPNARVIPISEQRTVFPEAPKAAQLMYIWIEDGTDSLNVSLIREGRYAATAMIDMVEHAQRTLDGADADLRQQLEQERAQVSAENRPRRLITDSDYAAKMQLVMQAEQDAKRDKNGLWSDAGLKGRSPPKDNYLMTIFAEHSDWFNTIANLVRADPRFLEINQEPTTWDRVHEEGLPPTEIALYADVLQKLGANEELTSFDGQACLIMADITYGLFDNGVIKGYVWSPSSPTPLVEDLDRWSSDSTATTAYRHVAGDWYLFELVH
jgi:hypothetical protein